MPPFRPLPPGGSRPMGQQPEHQRLVVQQNASSNAIRTVAAPSLMILRNDNLRQQQRMREELKLRQQQRLQQELLAMQVLKQQRMQQQEAMRQHQNMIQQQKIQQQMLASQIQRIQVLLVDLSEFGFFFFSNKLLFARCFKSHGFLEEKRSCKYFIFVKKDLHICRVR